MHLSVCNSLGLWARKPKKSLPPSATTTSTFEPDSDNSDDDSTDDGRLIRDDLWQLSDVDDDTMSIDLVDEDHAAMNENATGEEVDCN